MKNQVKTSQLAILYLLLVMGGKFLTLPSLIAGDVGHDSWLAVTFSFVWDGVCLCFLLWAIKLNKGKMDISEILNKSVTRPVSMVLLALFFVIFVLRVNILLSSCYKMFSVTFDVSTNWIVYLLSIAALAFFAVQKGFNAIARTGQVMFGLVVLSVAALFVSPLKEADMGALLPVGEAGWGNILLTSFTRSFWFSDYIFVYFVLEDIKTEKHLFAPMLISFAVGAALSILLNAVFAALFGHLAPNFDLAMSKIGVFSAASTTNGRWDWLTLSIWLVSVFIKVVVFVFCAYRCLEKICGVHFAKFNPIAAILITATLILPLFVSTDTLLDTVIKWGVIPFALVQYLLPLLMPLFVRVAERKGGAL